jgi:hypothetical protein
MSMDRITRRSRPLAAMVALLVSCGDASTRTEDAGTEAGAEGIHPDPNCHMDCFAATWCMDGVVRHQDMQMLACGWTDTCPNRVLATCQRGCASKPRLASVSRCPSDLCLENYPKEAGDPCSGEADCRPTRATIQNDGVVQTYLRCDSATQACVPTQAPQLADWLAPCDVKVISAVTPGAYGAVTDATCSGGVCTYFAAREQACVYQGCSKPCRTDDECPAGAMCEFDLWGDECPTTTSKTGYCAPGPLNQSSTALPCVP